MPLCPDCRAAPVSFDAPVCGACGWEAPRDHDLLDFVGRGDSESKLFAAYTELYERIAEDDLRSPIQEDELLELEAERLTDTLGSVAGAAVCDIGVGRGLIFRRLRAENPRLLVGVDLAPAYLRRLDTRGGAVKLLRANAENLPFSEELDVIVASDVLEHVLNAADFLHSAVTALVPGGRLLVKVPYRENISQYKRADGCPYPMVHLRTFDRRLLGEMLTDAGLQVEGFAYSGFYAGRWQPPLARFPRAAHALGRLLELRYGSNPGPNRINPRVGRVLMRPVVITALASKPR